ncbi:MAG: TonB-dependent receptor [Vicingaceae bacterium]
MLALVLWLSPLLAQESCALKLSGTIIDEHDQSALSYASIQFMGSSKGVSADDKGKYELGGICPGIHTLIITHIGCKPDTVQLQINQSQERDFYLEHHWEELKTVEVESESDLEQTASTVELDSNELADSKGLPLGEILKKMNGVSSMRTGSNISKPVIQGFSANRIQILNHGVQHEGQQWGDEHAPEIDPFVSANYRVIKGAGAVKYGGGALGGFVLVEPKPLPTKPGIRGEWNGLFATNNRMGNTALMLEGNFKQIPKFSWRVQGSLKKSGNIRTPNYYQKNTGVEEYNLSYTLGYKGKSWSAQLYYSQFNSTIGIFSGAHIGNLTDLERAIERSEPRPQDQEGFSYQIRRPYQLITHELVRLELNKYLANGGKLNLKISRQFNIREEFDKERPRNRDLAALNIPEFSLSLESYIAELHWELKEWKGIQTELGGVLNRQENTVNSFVDFIPDYERQRFGIFGLAQKTFEKVGLEAGCRLDQTDLLASKLVNRQFEEFDHAFSAITSNVGASYQLSNDWKIRLNLSYAERAPAINELYSEGLHHGTATLEFGNSNLKKEKSTSLNIEAEGKWKKLSMNVQAFHQQINDFIYLSPQGVDLTIRGAYPTFDWMNTDALMNGVDAKLVYTLSSALEYTTQWNFLWAEDLRTNTYLVMIPANRTQQQLTYQWKWKEENEAIRLSATYQYVFKQNRFDKEEEIATPPEGYGLWSFSAAYPFTYGSLKGRLGLQLNNAFNTVYRDYMNRFRFYTDEQGRDLQIRLSIKF